MFDWVLNTPLSNMKRFAAKLGKSTNAAFENLGGVFFEANLFS